jgi:transposase
VPGQALNPTCIVLEATGGYEAGIYKALKTAGLPVVKVNPRQDVRDFAKASGLVAKTDQLDARVLAHFARVMEPKATVYEAPEAIRALVVRRRQLSVALATEKTQAQQAVGPVVQADIHVAIEGLTVRIKALDEALAQEISAVPEL